MTPTNRLTVPNRAAVAAAIEEGRAHYNAGRLREAEAIHRGVLAAEPDNPEALQLLGVIVHQLRDSELAVDLISKAIAANPRVASYHSNLGLVLQEQGKLGDALAAYHRAVELEPSFVEAHFNLGNVLQEQGKLEDAVAAYHRAVELKPGFAEVHINLGNVLKEQGKLEDALAAYHRALELKPGFAEAHSNLGLVLQEQGKLDEAVVAYSRAIRIEPAAGIEVRLATLLPIIPESREALIGARQRFEKQVHALGKTDISLDDPYKEVGAANFLLAYHGLNDRDLQTAIARFYLKACPSLAWHAPETDRAGRECPRIGFISRHFGEHAIGWCYRGIIEQLDRQRFEVVVLTIGSRADAATEAMRTAVERSVALPDDLAEARAAIDLPSETWSRLNVRFGPQ